MFEGEGKRLFVVGEHATLLQQPPSMLKPRYEVEGFGDVLPLDSIVDCARHGDDKKRVGPVGFEPTTKGL